MKYAIATYVGLFRDETLYLTMKLTLQNNAQAFTVSLSTSQ